MGAIGDFWKKSSRNLAKIANKTQPHTWIMGEKESAKYDLGGQLLGAHDHLYKPKEVEAIPTGETNAGSTEAQAYVERDRTRRLARRALGRDSTVRTGPGGAPYTGAPKTLLGS